MQRLIDAYLVATMPVNNLIDAARGILGLSRIALKQLMSGEDGAKNLSIMADMARTAQKLRRMTPEEREEAHRRAKEHVDSIMEALQARAAAVRAAGAEN